MVTLGLKPDPPIYHPCQHFMLDTGGGSDPLLPEVPRALGERPASLEEPGPRLICLPGGCQLSQAEPLSNKSKREDENR